MSSRFGGSPRSRRSQPASWSQFSPSLSPRPKPRSASPWSSRFIVISTPPTSISSINSKDELLDHEQRLVNSGRADGRGAFNFGLWQSCTSCSRSFRRHWTAHSSDDVDLRLCPDAAFSWFPLRPEFYLVYIRGADPAHRVRSRSTRGRDADHDRARRSLHFCLQHRLHGRG